MIFDWFCLDANTESLRVQSDCDQGAVWWRSHSKERTDSQWLDFSLDQLRVGSLGLVKSQDVGKHHKTNKNFFAALSLSFDPEVNCVFFFLRCVTDNIFLCQFCCYTMIPTVVLNQRKSQFRSLVCVSSLNISFIVCGVHLSLFILNKL